MMMFVDAQSYEYFKASVLVGNIVMNSQNRKF